MQNTKLWAFIGPLLPCNPPLFHVNPNPEYQNNLCIFLTRPPQSYRFGSCFVGLLLVHQSGLFGMEHYMGQHQCTTLHYYTYSEACLLLARIDVRSSHSQRGRRAVINLVLTIARWTFHCWLIPLSQNQSVYSLKKQTVTFIFLDFLSSPNE